MGASIDFFSAIILLGTFLGLTVGLFLLFIKSSKNQANLFLGTSVLAFTIYLLPGFIQGIGWNDYFPYTINLGLFSPFLIGPMAYFYVKACTQKSFRLAGKMWLHLLPFLIHLIYSYEFFLLDDAARIEMQTKLYATGELYEERFWLVAKVFHNFIYFIFSAQIVFQYRKHIEEVSSSIDKNFHRWLWVFSSSLLIPVFVISAVIIKDYRASSLSLMATSIFVYIFAVYLAALFKPEIFHAFPHRIPKPLQDKNIKKKYENSNLKDAQKEKLIAKLQQYIQEEKPYQEPELTLTDLAERVHIPSNYLSQVINEKMDCTFMDFINQHRVEEAKDKLKNEKFSHYTIIAVAYEVGFNSKSAFYAAFKKHAKTTPSEFRKTMKEYV